MIVWLNICTASRASIAKKIMLSLYYKIWTDAITVTRASKTEGKNWKIFTIIPISALMGINLVTILLWIRAFSNRKFTVILPVGLTRVIPMNTFISIILTFLLPFIILNYLLIFYGDRYNLLIKIYRPKNGTRYFWYIGITLGVFALPYVLKWIF
jgi:hypothetical protein